jgi:signal transduction histidine kinase
MISLLGVPVSVQGRVVGDLYLTDKIGTDEFSEDEEWWLSLFARQAAVAIENAQLYKVARQARQRAETLAELTGTLNRSFKLEELFAQINQAASLLLELPAAALYLLNKEQGRFELEAQVGLDEKPNEEFFLPLQGSVAGKVLESGQSIFVKDTSVLEKIYFLPLQGKVLPGALLVVPIRQADRVSGVIEVYSAQPRYFSLEEISLLEAFAGQASLALEKAQIFQQREEFLSMTAHDLRAPLTAIKLSAGLLETSLPAELPPPLKNLASNISRNSERLNNLLEDLLELNRLEQGRVKLRPEKLELTEAIAATMHTLIPLFEEKTQTFSFERPAQTLWIWADRRRFEQILVNLVVNAHKYAPENSLIQIKLLVEPNWITIGVKDNGPGIPLEEQQHIFDRYYRRVIHELSSGSGLGLPIVRLLVELHGGQIRVESEPGKGSTFYLKLPLLSPNQP